MAKDTRFNIGRAVKPRLPVMRRQYHSVHAPIGGLRLDLGSTVIPERSTPFCENVTFERGTVRKSLGEETFGRTEGAPFSDTIMEFKVYRKAATVPLLMAFTESNVYYYKMNNAHFLNITQGEIVEDCEDVWETISGDITVGLYDLPWRGDKAAQITIEAAFATGIAAFENISLDLRDRTHIHFRVRLHKDSGVTSVASGDLRLILADAPGGVSNLEEFDIPGLQVSDDFQEVYLPFSDASALATVGSVALQVINDKSNAADLIVILDDIRAVNGFNGDTDNNFSAVVAKDVNDNDILIWTNGVDRVQTWDQSTEFASTLDGTTVRPVWLLIFGDRLCMYGDEGAEFPRRVTWSVAFDPENFSETGTGTGDLEGVLADGDKIMRAERLGDFAVIYGEHAIAIQQYRKNAVEFPFLFSGRVSTVGLAAPRALINLYGHEHIFLGWEDVYSFRGGRDVERLGGAIRHELFADINPQAIHKSFMVQHESDRFIRLYVPVNGSDLPNRYYELDLIEKVWSRGTRDYTAGISYESVDSMTWADLQTLGWSWQDLTDQGIRWADLTTDTNQAVPIYGDADGVVSRWAKDLYTVGGVVIDAIWDTKDFVTDANYRRGSTDWMEFNFEMMAPPDSENITTVVEVSYSTDLGETFVSLGSITPGAAWAQSRFDFEANSSQVRFRFRCFNSSFALRYFEVGYIPASDRAVV